MKKESNPVSQEKFKTLIGGQALIEGIMMQGPDKRSIVVRGPEGLVKKVEPLKKRTGIAKWPLIRGVVNFASSMVSGVKALMYSAEFFPEDEADAQPSKFEQWLEQKLGRLNIIVEDLGFLTPSVLKLVADSGFPGMKVIQFAFDSREGSNYLPHTYTEHCVVYTGTHDNDTLLGWMKTAPKESVKFAKEYLNLTKEEGYNWGMMRGAWSSVGELAVVPMQDLIGLGSEARMNTPSTLGGNWQWRATSDQITVKLAKRLYNYLEMYGRLWVGEDADRKEQ